MLKILVSSLCLVGCFSPSIEDGGFACGRGDTCPQNYYCAQSRCWSYYGPGPEPITPDAGSADVVSADLGVDSVSTPEVAQPLRLLGETCDPRNAGTAQRTDNCAVGLVCIDGNTQSVCFKRCTDSAECGQASCENRSPEPGAAEVSVCGLPAATCSPRDLASCPGQRACYLSENRTVCEITTGDNVRMACTYSRECLPGYACATGAGAGYCRQMCDDVSLCPTGTTCRPVVGVLGYCY